MKTQITSIVLVALGLRFSTSLKADDTKFLAAMQKNLLSLGAAKSVEAYQATANSFNRIAEAEKTRWEPYYYASLCYVLMTTLDEEATMKDTQLDEAAKLLSLSRAVEHDSSEVAALEGFIYMMRVSIDPATRGAKYASLAVQSFQSALTINPTNPRALALLAQMQYGMAKFFGTPPTDACNTLKLALQNFENDHSENPVSPKWGKPMAEGMQVACK